MALFTDVMTVYNYIEESQRWKRTVVKGVQWRHNKVEVSTSGGVQTEQKVESITIDFKKNYGNEQYVDYLEFNKLEDKTGYWTLNERDCADIVVLGESERELGADYKISDLKNEFQYMGTVLSVSDNRNRRLLQHIKVVAK